MKIIRLAKKIGRRVRYDAIVEAKRLSFYREVKNYSLNREPRDEELIVSLASYPARFNNLHLVIGSIFKQSVKPDRIILNLCEDEMNEELTTELKMLQEQGLEVYIREENFRPHNKYYFTMRDNPDSTVITVDDDHIYSPYMIQELVDTHKRFPDCVVACRGHRILFNNGEAVNYEEWRGEYDYPYQPTHAVLATGVGGVLYPAGSLHKEALNKELFKELCLGQDDLWLKAMEVLNGTKVVLCNQAIWNAKRVLEREQITGLVHDNVDNNRNDVGWKNLLDYFKLTEKDFE